MALSIQSWVANEGGKHLVLIMWLGVNTWLFLRTFMTYCSGQQYFYLHKMLGLGLCVSRASASVLNLNCSLVLLPMCRSLLTYLRGTHAVNRKTRRLLDKSKTFHVACGVAICVFSVVHVSAHLANLVNFSVKYSEEFPALNVARYRGEDPRIIILTTVPGVTGVLLVLVLFLMFTASSYCIRFLLLGWKLIVIVCVFVITDDHSYWPPLFLSYSFAALCGCPAPGVCRLYVDGPFGSPSEDVFNYEVSLCVAGGIGVTPFACVLHTLLDGWRTFRLKRLYFVWVCRELQSFYWFAELLCTLHHKLWQENRPDYLNLHLFLSQTDRLQSMSEEKYRLLSSRILIGRPKWKLLFDEIGRANKHKRVGVFCCGPKGLSKMLHRLCNSDQYSGTTFEFNKESFI
ncbi:NADPH oxidase 4 [Osmerus mordax]|uniref:NADPH oxidase 4 n=1 Tax=Osmerus mordax TaxID=8014 RepID=UPI00350EE77C